MTADKVIVTNLSVLKLKYSTGFPRIRNAIGRLVRAQRFVDGADHFVHESCRIE